ncbi:hypothetical protein A3H22_01025 [Candidatus Peribacteria bacterium RIFCSPLOWO2_12_FULL_55_15]|nr:MAG: hypothetical protein A2789_00540 [Candidatus Peribacteria bacterium RIFCSPHIGHO2_01_FULL_54_22]OGJ63548.1 MAG: hypothetical protein A3D12_03815 [Candidatus Peribacteria bacterium RIFCSPHIGHO2_02_FULL_55_24]OGJ63833.1 MAG: hypothetical protein A3E47_01820 [Candidatus Peribacteria bacterium RIFCSPHIGHO2_12_FULL_54_10]OGJ67662.1 MAG: hypothetical protein A2947_00705 [Candidatus Peribacteria bacterium RIFCSPLOWO2_01_FULL_54_110]OGJ69535.1 MAG: hypothetical protein A3H90_02715 [Candidatus Pe
MLHGALADAVRIRRTRECGAVERHWRTVKNSVKLSIRSFTFIHPHGYSFAHPLPAPALRSLGEGGGEGRVRGKGISVGSTEKVEIP